MFLISTSHLRKTFGTTVAIDDVNLQVEAGEIYGLVGSDGAGKTTTIRLLVGALKPDSGKASICGYDVESQVENARGCLGYLSQRFSLYEDLTVLENIRFFAELRGLSPDEWQPRCMEILRFVGLADFSTRRAGQLSGGMRQKLGLASAMVTNPQLLLLDEPTTGVDPVTRQDFWKLIIRIAAAQDHGEGGRKTGRGVLLTTPYMDEASRCHRIGFMRNGRIIAEGAPTQLRAVLDGRIVEVQAKNLPTLRGVIMNLPEVEDVCLFGDRLHLRTESGQGERVVVTIKNTIQTKIKDPLEARLIPPTLEDVFIFLSGEK